MNDQIPKDLPECKLLNILADVASKRKDINFPFLQRLDDFRARVSAEVQYINQLFPEYTPHDANYHIGRLFHVADKLMTQEKLLGMNSAELFVLACGLYGHDWGMAVNENEKQFILSGKLSEGAKLEDLWILRDEQSRFQEFAQQHNLPRDPKGGFTAIKIELWQAYVRLTHAYRSAERARRYFETFGEGISEAVSRVCEAHWLDFSDLREETRFPQDFSVLGENVNLRAIAVYVRLVDLFDIANDRTPYIIWKYVAPRDVTSRMEWDKHRALQPITFPDYQEGRIVQVDGSTEDHEVYAALEDLKVFCEEQLKECKDILAQMNDARYFLNIYHISWRVISRGFKTPSIRFDFDRKRMFEIFSDQIYQGNPYVFLRELLQNSIDAIRMRKQVLSRHNIKTEELGSIRVNVDHKNNGDVIVTWTDDGVGMDEYIIKNFLAVAGKSYYSSKEFEDLGITFDPISKFGIGILSCFLVADRVDIETHRDPYLAPNSVPLNIYIPDVEKHFRIEQARPNTPYGTTVKVYVQVDKLMNAYRKMLDTEYQDECVQFEATEYLVRIAGFVEFPIVVTETGKTTIILHPDTVAPIYLQKKIDNGAIVKKLYCGLSLEECIYSQDISIAKKYLREEQIDIERDLKLPGFQGKISFILPISNDIDWNTEYGDIRIINQSSSRHIIQDLIRLKGVTQYYKKDFMPDYSGYASVFRDGVFVGEFEDYISPLKKIITNLTNFLRSEIDVSRTRLLGKSQNWEIPVDNALLAFFNKSWIKDAMSKTPEERLFLMSRGCSYYHLDINKVWQVSDTDRWPLPFIDNKGKLLVLEWAKIRDQEIPIVPLLLQKEVTKLLWYHLMSSKDYVGPLKSWNGGIALINNYIDISRNKLLPNHITYFCDFWRPIMKQYFRTIRFISAPGEGNKHWAQEILIPIKKNATRHTLSIEEIIRIFVENPDNLTDEMMVMLQDEDESFDIPYMFQRIARFPEPYEKAFAYGWDWMNFNHPMTKELLRLLALLWLSNRDEILSQAQKGTIDDAADQLPYLQEGKVVTKAILRDTQTSFDFILKLCREYGIIKDSRQSIQLPGADEFIPGTFVERSREEPAYLSSSKLLNKKFGQPAS